LAAALVAQELDHAEAQRRRASISADGAASGSQWKHAGRRQAMGGRWVSFG
jgi:hypothetical protein